MAILGALLWIVATVFAVETTRMRRGSPPLLGHLPTAFLLDRVDAGDEWALSVLNLRSKDPELTPENAGELLRGLLQRGVPPLREISSRLYLVWAKTKPNPTATIPLLSNAAIVNGSVRGDQYECEIAANLSFDPSASLFRIERVTIDGRDVEWSLDRAPSTVDSASGQRTFRGLAHVRTSLPSGVASGALVEVTMTNVLSRAALGLIFDERANTPTAPLEWPVPVATATIKVSNALPFPSASDSTADKRSGESP